MIDNLIYDVGMNDGSDTAYYLHKGYKVIAVEPNPYWVSKNLDKFEKEISTGQLKIINKAIDDCGGSKDFFISKQFDVWSSLDYNVAKRGLDEPEKVIVEAVKFKDLLLIYGVPFYLKIDIEGKDKYCLESLSQCCHSDYPKYISIEAHNSDYLFLLKQMGYTKFKIVSQVDVPKQSTLDWEFVSGSSGGFGEDTPNEWKDVDWVLYDWLHLRYGNEHLSTLNKQDWFDFHATKEG
jgi:FkbM family methyltransferase